MLFSLDNEDINAQILALSDRHFLSTALVNAHHLLPSEISIVDPNVDFDPNLGIQIINSMVNDQRPPNDDLIKYILAKSILSSNLKIDNININLNSIIKLINNNNKSDDGDSDKHDSKENHFLPLYLLTLIVVYQKGEISDDILNFVLTTLNSNIKTLNTTHQYIYLQLLKELVYFKSIRLHYLKLFGTHDIIDILTNNYSKLNLQMKYTLIFIIWTFSFNTKFPNEINKLIPLLFIIAKDGVKEKVIRLSISTLMNLASNDTILKKYLLSDGVNILKSLCDRKWSDEELKLDLDALRIQLEQSISNLTTWDEYYDELKSGQFQWSPTHKSQEFWLDNSGKFKENNWKYVKDMVKLLQQGDENGSGQEPASQEGSQVDNQLYLNQAIICFDLSKLIELLPEIIVVLTKIGAKTKIMTLMNSPNPNVKYEALKTTQLLVSKSI